jgi:hypothetical protein
MKGDCFMKQVITREEELCDLVVIELWEAENLSTGEIVTVEHDTDWHSWHDGQCCLSEERTDLSDQYGRPVYYSYTYGSNIAIGDKVAERSILRFDDRFSDIWLGITNHAEFMGYDGYTDMHFRCIADRQKDGSLIIVYYIEDTQTGELRPVDENSWGIDYYADDWEFDYERSLMRAPCR